MDKFERLLAENEHIEVVERNFKSKAKGLCKGNKIALNKNLSTTEKVCVLAEELGHNRLTVGNILNQNKASNKKQELIARRWAYEKLIGLSGLVQAYKDNIQGLHNLAEYFEVTPEFFQEAIDYYKTKYGLYKEIDTYILIFEPLGIIDKFIYF